MVTSAQLERVAEELLAEFNITSPPIPIESILQHPKPGMWEELDMSQISGGFFQVTANYSPRMSMARLLVRQLARCPWGIERGLDAIKKDQTAQHVFARMLVMPKAMITQLEAKSQTPETISQHFEVPDDEARQRLEELKND